MYGHFAYVYVCAPLTCLVPMEAGRQHRIPWSWSHRGCELSRGLSESNWGPLEEQSQHLTTGSSFQPYSSAFLAELLYGKSWDTAYGMWSSLCARHSDLFTHTKCVWHSHHARYLWSSTMYQKFMVDSSYDHVGKISLRTWWMSVHMG